MIRFSMKIQKFMNNSYYTMRRAEYHDYLFLSMSLHISLNIASLIFVHKPDEYNFPPCIFSTLYIFHVAIFHVVFARA